MQLEIRLVNDPNELLAVYRQRYAIYVEELQYPQRYADHAARTVREPLDDSGHVLAAFDEGQLVASVRINYGAEETFREYADLYQMRRFAHYYPDRLSTCTKLMVAPRHRSGSVTSQLCAACYKYPPVHGIGNAFNLIDTVPALASYFRRLGYRQIQPRIHHPDVGEVVPLVLSVYDKEYLTRIRSPFAQLLPGKSDKESVQWFYDRFAEELVKCQGGNL